MHLNKYKGKFKAILPTIVIIFVLYILSRIIPPNEVERIVVAAGPFAPLVYIIISLLTYIIAPLSGTPIAFIGFHLFGSSVVLLHTISAFISFSVNFWIARKWGREVVEKFAGKDSLSKVDKFITQNGYFSLFLVRVLLATYHDFISYAAGLTNMRYLPYLIISTAGIIPGYTIWFFVARSSNSAVVFTLSTFVVAGIFITIFGVWKKLSKKRETIE